MAYARCMLDKQVYTHAHRHAHMHRDACNTYCYSTATLVTRTRLKVTLYVHCLPSFEKLMVASSSGNNPIYA